MKPRHLCPRWVGRPLASELWVSELKFCFCLFVRAQLYSSPSSRTAASLPHPAALAASSGEIDPNFHGLPDSGVSIKRSAAGEVGGEEEDVAGGGVQCSRSLGTMMSEAGGDRRRSRDVGPLTGSLSRGGNSASPALAPEQTVLSS